MMLLDVASRTSFAILRKTWDSRGFAKEIFFISVCLDRASSREQMMAWGKSLFGLPESLKYVASFRASYLVPYTS